MPAVSVVLPTFNRADTLGRAIRSVLAQTYVDLELIVVDDASTDRTADVVAALRDPRLRLLRLPRNRGAAGARNAGIAEAQGEWLAFQDSDDEWLLAKLAAQMRLAVDSGADLVIGGYIATQGGQTFAVRPAATLIGGDPRLDLLDGWPIITPTWLVRKSLLQDAGGFDESFPCLEDWDLVFRLSDRCRIAAVGEPILLKHGQLDSVCADPHKLALAMERILAGHGARWQGQPQRLARRLAHLGCLQYRLGRRPAARDSFRRACVAAPGIATPRALLAASYGGERCVRLAQRLGGSFATMAPGRETSA